MNTTTQRVSVWYGEWGNGYSRHTFKTLERARAYARKVMPRPTIARTEAMDQRGCLQASTPLSDLFGLGD
jgi:hypothetical protein